MILLTRTATDNARTAVRLNEMGLQTMGWPLSRIITATEPVRMPDDVEALIFTSSNGVLAFAELCDVRDLPAYCVGPRTTETAQQAGFANARQAGQSASDLANSLGNLGAKVAMYPRARDVSADLVTAAQDVGLTLYEAVVYRAEPADVPDDSIESALANRRFDVISIWSRRNAGILATYLTRHPQISLGAATLVAISENAAEPLRMTGFGRIVVAKSPDADGMIDAMAAAVRQDFRRRSLC